MRNTPLYSDEAIHALRVVVHAEGSRANAARKLRVHPTLISNVLNGRLPPPPKLLKALGLKRLPQSYARVTR